MPLSSNEKAEVESLVKISLDKAESVWRIHGGTLVKKSLGMDAIARADSIREEKIPSRIPRHPLVDGDNPKVDNFIALVADMRNSSDHLLCAISDKRADASLLERVYYETAALLPALEMTVSYEGGAVTEYLGDGILALFSLDEADRKESIKKAYRSARNCLGDTRSIVNSELNKRYRLPPINLGVGLSYSKALVQLVGIVGDRHPKVVGNCIFYASKLSKGNNEIFADDTIRYLWPSSEGGKLRFIEKSVRGTKGFLISRED